MIGTKEKSTSNSIANLCNENTCVFCCLNR